jgi:hypothetical protein
MGSALHEANIRGGGTFQMLLLVLKLLKDTVQPDCGKGKKLYFLDRDLRI